MRILTYSSLQSASLQKALLSYTTSHLLAMLLASLTAPPAPHGQQWVMLFLCSVLAIPVTVQLSLALTWLYFHLDNSYFRLANIHFIPEVPHPLSPLPPAYTFPQDAIQTDEAEMPAASSRPRISWKLESASEVTGDRRREGQTPDSHLIGEADAPCNISQYQSF
jgi:hypothetical protein